MDTNITDAKEHAIAGVQYRINCYKMNKDFLKNNRVEVNVVPVKAKTRPIEFGRDLDLSREEPQEILKKALNSIFDMAIKECEQLIKKIENS